MTFPLRPPTGARGDNTRLGPLVAERIREMIVTGELGEGERLPPLDVLLDEFGVSAPSMREALRILESEGLVSVQRGSIGGAVVHRPTHEMAAYTLALILRSQGTDVTDLGDALASLEPICAGLCATRSDRKKTVVPELRRINQAASEVLDDARVFGAHMTAFHEAVVRGCGNQTLTLVVGALESIRLAQMARGAAPAATSHPMRLTRNTRLPEIEVHEQIAELINDGDEASVRKVMTEHVQRNRQYRKALGIKDHVKERVDIKGLRADT